MKKKILAIDDSKAIRFLLRTVLGDEFDITTAPDGCAGMYWLSKKELPDLIIMDAQLPDMQNWELIEQLATSRLYRHIPIIVISSLNTPDIQIRCLEYGVIKCFAKPFNPLSLLETVRIVCSSSNARKFTTASVNQS